MSDTTWTKLPALPGKPNPCLSCPDIGQTLAMDRLVAVGFGDARVERDGETVLDGELALHRGEEVRVADAEALAAADPDHDWRIVFFAPLHGETYQRHGEGAWVLVEDNMGFA